MNDESVCIYQSNEIVLITGVYEVVGALNATYTLHIDELFPDYDGRAVCWHLMNEIATSQPLVNITPTSAS